MSKQNFYLKKLFNSALQNHKANNPQVAEKKYRKILKINPNHLNSIFLLGTLSILSILWGLDRGSYLNLNLILFSRYLFINILLYEDY